jgi:hypothetical protein
MKFSKWIFAAVLFSIASVNASTQEWISVEVKVKSHHGDDETMSLKVLKDKKSYKLIVDDFVLPETRILTNKQDLDAIVNFSEGAKDAPCGRDRFFYIKKAEGKSTQFSGCPTSQNFQVLRKSFRNISVIK